MKKKRLFGYSGSPVMRWAFIAFFVMIVSGAMLVLIVVCDRVGLHPALSLLLPGCAISTMMVILSCMLGKMKTAIHEAGHATCIARLDSGSIKSIRIGLLGFGAVIFRDDAEFIEKSAERCAHKIMVFMAGWVAEEVFGYKIAGLGSGEDRYQAYRYVRKLIALKETGSVDDILQELYVETKAMIVSEKAKIEELAKVVRKSKYLDGESVYKILNA